MKRTLAIFIALSTGAIASTAEATECTFDSFSIDTMKSSATGVAVALPGIINATGCFGVNTGNDAQGGTNEPTNNLGWL